MPLRPYSFRFPYDIRTTWEAMRKKFMTTGGNVDPEYDVMLNRLGDRDRELEDHLNIEVAQGVLNYKQSTTLFEQWTAAQSDVRDLTGLTITITLPTNRAIRVTGQALFNSQNAVDAANFPQLFGYITVDGVATSIFGLLSHNLGFAGIKGALLVGSGSIILTPTAGEHVFKLQGQSSGAGDSGQGSIEGSSAVPAFIIVEDIGPSARFS